MVALFANLAVALFESEVLAKNVSEAITRLGNSRVFLFSFPYPIPAPSEGRGSGPAPAAVSGPAPAARMPETQQFTHSLLERLRDLKLAKNWPISCPPSFETHSI